MQYLYIDESGSMTTQHAKNRPYFVIAIVRTENPQKLRSLQKRFIAKHRNKLKESDSEGRMFKGDEFEELKGSAFTPELKRNFVSYFCREGTLEVYYVVLENRKVADDMYENTARTFNYIVKEAISSFLRQGLFSDDMYMIQLDERNEKTDSRSFLQNYLNTELRMGGQLSKDIRVEYFDSSKNRNIQIADVLANFYYSQLCTSNYDNEINAMKQSGCLKYIFQYPK